MRRYLAGILTLLLLGACSDSSDGGGSEAIVDAAGSDASEGDAGTDAGEITLQEPRRHRAERATCDDARPAGPRDLDRPFRYGADCVPQPACAADADCADGENGRCVGNETDGFHCTYDECFTDSDCETGYVCECGGGEVSDNNVCVPAQCETDADCGEDGYCSPSGAEACGSGDVIVAYECRTVKDTCLDDADCSADGSSYCGYDANLGYWRCLGAEICSCEG